MQITIHDHDTQVGPNRGDIKFRWWVNFSVDGEEAYNISRQLVFDFSDFAAYLIAKGEFDGWENSDDEGMVWRNNDQYEPGYIYSFEEIVHDYILSGDLDDALKSFLAVKVSEACTAAA